MITYGKGGWSWEALYYHIPVFLRNFYIKEMVMAMEREEKAYRSPDKKVVVDNKIDIPSYLKTAAKKQ